MASLRGRTQQVLVTGVYGFLTVTGLLGATAIANVITRDPLANDTIVSASPMAPEGAEIQGRYRPPIEGLQVEALREIPLPMIGGVAGVSQGRDFTLVLGEDGRIWARGNNEQGQLGVGVPMLQSRDFLPLPGREYRAVAAGGGHALAIDRRGNLWAWGDNQFGQLGNGTPGNQPQKRPLKIAADIVAIAAGDRHSLAIRRDGTCQ